MNVDSPADLDPPEALVERSETLVRVLLTVLFIVLLRLAEAVILALAVFSLLYTLVTQREVAPRVRRLGNQVLSYLVSVIRYLTYNDDRVPFPFSDLPPELDYVPRTDPS